MEKLSQLKFSFLATVFWFSAGENARLCNNKCFTLPFKGVENSTDVALYSGLAAGAVTVVLLIIAVTLYRRSQSEYGVDVIDSSALTGGFQSFSFKTSRQGEPPLKIEFPPIILYSVVTISKLDVKKSQLSFRDALMLILIMAIEASLWKAY